MKYKILGKTALKVSVVGFGGIPIQRVNSEKATSVIAKAEEIGINYIDTARGYTVSEEFIGNALAGRRKNWIIATKSMSKDKNSMAKDIDISLKNLRTDYIDLYQLHNSIRSEDELKAILSEGGAYEALIQAKKAGKIGHIGITSHNLDLLKTALETGKFESMMVPYNIVETQAEELLKRARELHIGTIIMKPMAGGAIDDKSLALRYIFRNECVDIAIPGMAELQEVETNAAAADEKGPLSARDLQVIDQVRERLGNAFCRRCNYCAPCSQGIEIPNQFLFSGYKERYDLAGWAESRYFAQKIRANACVECGECEKRCPYGLPIREMLKNVRKVFDD